MKYPKKSKDFEENKKQGKKCLLMYSGGVDTSTCVYLLQKYYGYEVITLTIDVCQDEKWAHDMAKKAKKLGAVKAIVYDGKEEYADKYLSSVIKANGMYDDYYPVGTSIARPWQAKIGMEVALKEGVDAIAHGNKGRGAGAFQFNMVMNFFMKKGLKLVTPIGDWWPTREEEIAFAYKKKIPVPVPEENPFSYDDNIMSNAINYGDLDYIDKTPPEEAFTWTKALKDTPDKAQKVSVEFKKGLPVKLNGTEMKLADLIMKLNKIAGKHGIGRIDMIENGLYGNKVKWIYEAPAAQILIEAHKDIEKIVLPKDTQCFKHEIVDKKWTKLVYHALMYTPLSVGLMEFIESMQQYVNGKVTYELYKGNFTVLKREVKQSLVNVGPSDVKAKIELDKVPYGFEEYSFSSLHPKVLENYLGKYKESTHENKCVSY